ncbi:WYL domain-containing protein [Paracoccus sp. P2]|uniref:WYL domain-containing protein n=1 Tax=Paracoccus sp. P2 TaxID=3248840 RepID=UPI00391EF14B
MNALEHSLTPNRELVFIYKNWRGETSQRRVEPEGIWFGETEWHSGQQWFLRGVDIDKGEIRDFALVDIQFQSR